MAIPAREARPSPIALNLLYVAIGLQFAQLVLFNVLPENIRLGLSGVTFVVSVPAALIVSVKRSGNYILFWLVAGTMILAWAGSALLHGYPSTPSNVAQNLSAVTWPIMLLGLIGRVRARLPVVLAASTIILAGLVALALDPITFAGTTRPASFTGGTESPHSAGYALAGAMAVLWLRDESRIKWPLLAVGLLLLFAFGSRTSWAMCAVFILIEAGRRIYRGAGLLALTPAIPLALAGAAVVLNTEADWNEFSSGRLSVYSERFKEFSNSDLATIMFGRGAGSDVQASDQWWWSEKVSHNDLLGALNERGMLGALGYLIYLSALFYYSAGRGRTVAAMIMTASILSGIMLRPLALFFLFIALAIGGKEIRHKRSSSGKMTRVRRRSTAGLSLKEEQQPLPSVEIEPR